MAKTRDSATVIEIWQFVIATVGALLIGILFIQLPNSLVVGPRWLLFAIEVVLLIPPTVARLSGRHLPHSVARSLVYALLAALTIALFASIFRLVEQLSTLSPHILLISGVLLWSSNVLVFASWYWETDGDGPVSRHHAGHEAADFQFPQQVGGNTERWHAGFIDYLFLAFCSATALSPADTMPLTRRAKLLMMTEAIISMLVILMILARFVNVA